MSLRLEDYEVTNEGDVISPRKKLKPWISTKGYAKVTICGKHHTVHRLVATRFIPNPDNKPQVNHLNGNKLDNRVGNLEWATGQENKAHAYANNLYSTKLSDDSVKEILSLKGVETLSEIARMYNVTPNSIKKILDGRRKTWGYE